MAGNEQEKQAVDGLKSEEKAEYRYLGFQLR